MSVIALILMSEKLGDGGWVGGGWVVVSSKIKDWLDPIDYILIGSANP